MVVLYVERAKLVRQVQCCMCVVLYVCHVVCVLVGWLVVLYVEKA